MYSLLRVVSPFPESLLFLWPEFSVQYWTVCDRFKILHLLLIIYYLFIINYYVLYCKHVTISSQYPMVEPIIVSTNLYQSLPILIDPYWSLLILINLYQSLPILTNPYRSLLILTDPYQSLSILTNQYQIYHSGEQSNRILMFCPFGS